jgi:hypothetical protein
MSSYKKDFEVAMLFSSQNIEFPFLFEETLKAFLLLSFSLSLFSILFLFFLCSVSFPMAWDDMANL